MKKKSKAQTVQKNKLAILEFTAAKKTIRKLHHSLIRDTIELELVKRGISCDQITINELFNYETPTAHTPRPGNTIVTPELNDTIRGAVADAFDYYMDEEYFE